jgi:hypothetical protein
MILKRGSRILAVAMFAAAMAGAQNHANLSHTEEASRMDRTIHLLTFKMDGELCNAIKRHCNLTLFKNGDNTLAPHPVVYVPGDRLYVRVFRDNLADLLKPQRANKTDCFTYSVARIQLDKPRNDGILNFGAQVRSLLSDLAAVSGPPQQTNTVVLVFETEPENPPDEHSVPLKLKTQADVTKYFQNAIEITYTAEPGLFKIWSDNYKHNQQLIAQVVNPSESAPRGSQSFAAMLGAVILSIGKSLDPTASAKTKEQATPAAPVAPVSAPVKGPPEQCNIIGADVPLPHGATYTVSLLQPVSELKPSPCGE